MAVRILLIRHGETAWNRGKIFRGTHDVPLNDNGLEQARHLAEALRGREIHAAYTSPLSRATETARVVLEPHGLDPVVEQGLKDFHYGDWTGLEEAVVAAKWPEEHEQWTKAPHGLRVPGGDTLTEVREKAFGAMENLVRAHDGQTIALFAHRVVNKVLVLAVLGLGLDRFPYIRQDNCCLNQLQWKDGEYIVIGLNDVNHISRAGTALLQADF